MTYTHTYMHTHSVTITMWVLVLIIIINYRDFPSHILAAGDVAAVYLFFVRFFLFMYLQVLLTIPCVAAVCFLLSLQMQQLVTLRWPDVPDFQGQSPFSVTCPWTKLSLKMSQILTLNGGKCPQTQSNTSYYGSHLTHRQRWRRMTYKRSSVNNNNLEAAKRKEKKTSGRDKWYVVY